MAVEDWKKIVAAPVAELLRKHGFRKNGLRFSANRGDAKLLVEFQSSQMSDKTHLKITVNLTIRLGQLDHDPSILPGDGHWRKRIGSFTEKPGDCWWVCRNDEDAIQAGKTIAILLENSRSAGDGASGFRRGARRPLGVEPITRPHPDPEGQIPCEIGWRADLTRFTG